MLSAVARAFPVKEASEKLRRHGTDGGRRVEWGTLGCFELASPLRLRLQEWLQEGNFVEQLPLHAPRLGRGFREERQLATGLVLRKHNRGV